MIKKGGVLKYFFVLFILSSFCLRFFLFKDSSGCCNIAEAKEQSVVLNEIAWMGTDVSANDEWIELFNETSANIVLDGWKLVSQDGTPEIDMVGTIKAGGYFLLERSDDETVPDRIADLIYTGALGNTGEYLELFDSDGLLIDFINIVETWPAGDNTSKQTMSRTIDGKWLNSLDAHGTPGAENNFAAEPPDTKVSDHTSTASTSKEEMENTNVASESESSPQTSASRAKKKSSAKDKIIISEIFPNPLGSDRQSEFIELYNAGPARVNLQEWQIGDESQKRFRFRGEKFINAGDFLVLYRKETGIALNNTGDTVSLYKKDRKTAVDKLKYKDSEENMSYNCLTSDFEILGQLANVDCEWSKSLTPGRTNKIILANRAPGPEFSVGKFLLARTSVLFDSSDTLDPDEDKLTYFWDFGDGFSNSLAMPEHTYAKAGKYKVSMKVSDGEFVEEIFRTINIMDWEVDASALGTSTEAKIDWGDIAINEILPNPKGPDGDGEFVEIVNKGQDKINLLNWQIDDEAGGSQPFKFNEPIFLGAGEYYLLDRVDSGIVLNNSRDEVRIIAPDDSIVDLISYGQAPEGEAYARNDNADWSWHSLSTPGEKNNSELLINDKSKNIVKINKKVQARSKIIKKVLLDDLEKIKLGETIVVQGTVVVEPGILSSQYFYIIGSKGVQVYNYKKDFPKFSVGDLISVQGELTKTKGELRLKTKDTTDMVVLKRGSVSEPKKIKCVDVGDISTATLLEVSGEVVEKKGSSIFLDDGTGEILVYVKQATDIDLGNITKGDKLTVIGILSSTDNGQKLMPRGIDDITFFNSKNLDHKADGQVLGAELKNKEWTLTARDQKREDSIYFFMILGAGIIIVLGIFFRYKIQKK